MQGKEITLKQKKLLKKKLKSDFERTIQAIKEVRDGKLNITDQINQLTKLLTDTEIQKLKEIPAYKKSRKDVRWYKRVLLEVEKRKNRFTEKEIHYKSRRKPIEARVWLSRCYENDTFIEKDSR